MKNLILFAIIFISSCTVGPDYEAPVFFDNEEIKKSIGIQGDEEKKDLAGLFSPYDFKDETLNTLMDKVQENSPTIKSAILRLKQARESLKITSKNSFPIFDLSGKYNFVNESNNMAALFNSDYYEAGVDMSWEIDIFGSNRRKTEASKALFMAQLYNLKYTNVSLVSEIAVNYINLRNAEELLKDAKENLQIQQEAYEIILDQYKVALTDEITVSQAKYLLETTKMLIPELEYQKEMYANALAVLVGELPNALDEMLDKNTDNLVAKLFEYDVEKLYSLPISVVRNRPDVKMAEENLIAQNAEVGVAIASLYPSFSLSGFLGIQSSKWSNLAEKDSVTNSLIPSLNLPLFHWGNLRSNVRLQKYMKEEMLLNLEMTLLNAVNEVKNTIIAIEKEYQINKSAVEAYENMQLVSELNWKKYTLGLVGFSDVLDAEQRRLSAQTDMVNSNAKLYRNLVAFYKAIGGKPIYEKEEKVL